jgi:hypothetical protein
MILRGEQKNSDKNLAQCPFKVKQSHYTPWRRFGGKKV